MRQSSNFAAFFAAFALLLAGAARAGQTVTWTHTGSGTWDSGSSSNWTGSSTNQFNDGDAVVFGLDLAGNPTGAGYHVAITGSGVTIGSSGTNPGAIIGSGSWLFSGGNIKGGSFLVTGSSEVTFGSISASNPRQFQDQRFDVVDGVDFTLNAADNSPIVFTGSTSGTLAGGAIHTGSDSNLTLATTGTLAGFFFHTNTTSARGGAIHTGGDLTILTPASGSNNWINVAFVGNSAGGEGGAIYSGGNVTIGDVSGTGILLTGTFVANKSGAAGGAIFAKGDVSTNGSLTVGGNEAAGSGGAIYSEGNVTITATSGTSTFVSNTAGANGGAIYAAGDVTLAGKMSITDNTSGTNSTGAGIYAGGNLSLSGSDTHVAIYGNKISGSGAPQTSSLAYVGGDFTLADDASLIAGGGLSAQSITVTSATLAFGEGDAFAKTKANSGLTLTIIDSAGAATAGTIRFENAVLSANYGTLAVNAGSRIEISGTALVINAVGGATGNYTEIAADITGTAAIVKTGTGAAALTGSNSYTGTTHVARGTLMGNVNDSLEVQSGATYATGYFAGSGTILVAIDRSIARIDGPGLINMQGANLTAQTGVFTGTLRDVARLTKAGSDTLVLGTGTIGNLDITDGALNIASDRILTVSGTTTLAASTTLGVNISNTHALRTGALEAADATSVINVTGVGLVSNYTTGTTFTLIVSDTAITRNYTFLIDGSALGGGADINQFLTFEEDSAASANKIAVKTSLVWNGTAAGSAHGTFHIGSGTFILNAGLNDNTDAAAWAHGWDGKSLTKTGDGTLVLGSGTISGTSTSTGSGTNAYTGVTIARGGLLLNQSEITNSEIIVEATGTFANAGIIHKNIINQGSYILRTSGTMLGNVSNTGTFTISIDDDYEWSGTLGGATGLVVKTGESTFTHAGDSTFTGTVQIDNGSFASGKAHNLDSASAYNITGLGVLSLGGYNQTLKKVVNEGVLNFGPAPSAGVPVNFATATIASYATGTSGTTGFIVMRSDYGAGLADRLVITGTASGTHIVQILNADKVTPDKTRAYIPLIEGAAVVSSNTNVVFTGTVDVGMGRLIVTRGDGRDLGPNADIWYLASGNEASNLGDAILSTASVAGLEWHYQLDTVRQRMGDLRQEALMAPPAKRESPLAYTTVTSKGGNAWLRGNAYHIDASASVTTDAFEEDVYGISFGYDKTYRWENNQYLLGAFANISNVTRDFDIRGDGKTNSYGVGAYFSYLKDNGWYGDANLLISSNNNEFTAHPFDRLSDTVTGSYKTLSWGLSIEAGKVIRSKTTGWWAEPSVQAAIAVVNGQTYATSTGMDVKTADANIRQVRAGVRAGYDTAGSRIKPYVRAAAVSVATRGGRVRAGSPEYPQYYTADMDGRRLEAGIGASWVFDEKSQLYLDYEYAKADNYKRPWAISLGYRSTW